MSDKKYKIQESKRKWWILEKLLPTHFSMERDHEEDTRNLVRLNVYRLTDSSFGFYHSGVEFLNVEYTYCCGIGICYHKPKQCHFATLLGTIQLGYTEIDIGTFQDLLKGTFNILG